MIQLKRIELLKKEKYTLEEIKKSMAEWNSVCRDELVAEKLTALQMHMRQLEREVKEISPLLEEMKPRKAKYALRAIAAQSAACIEAILLLLGKGPLI